MKRNTVYEELFNEMWNDYAAEYPIPARNFHFHPERQWNFDFAWADLKVAVEIDGGNRMARIRYNKNGKPIPFAVGRHTLVNDYEKINCATLLGWSVIRFLPEQIKETPTECVDLVKTLIDRKESDG